jgi:hypothetical protein
MLRINSATKNLVVIFLFLIQRIGKGAKQMLHFVQHDTTATPNGPKDSGFLATFVSLHETIDNCVVREAHPTKTFVYFLTSCTS